MATAKSKKTPPATAIERHRGGGLAGRDKTKGAELSLDTLELAAAPGADEPRYDRPRPAKSRYPISPEAYVALKQAARADELPTLAQASATPVKDRGRPGTDVGQPEFAAPGAAFGPEPSAPSSAGNFGGISATGWTPPDCHLAAGPAHLLLAVNSSVAIYDKSGSRKLAKTLDSWFGNVITAAKIFDPKTLYDQHAGRWVLVAMALGTTTNQSWFLLSVSKTSDPLGGWFNYKLDATKDGTTATTNWADYPGLGVDAQAIYLTANMFKFGGNYQYAKLRVVPKAAPYAGTGIAFTDFVKLKNLDGSPVFTIQPCHTYGAPQVQYFVNSKFPTPSSPTQSGLTLWSLTDPLGAPALAKRNVPTIGYALPPDAPQKGGGEALDTGDVRVLNAVFRGGSVWAAFTTAHDWGSGNAAALAWFQIEATAGTLIQQGIYGAVGRSYFYPALMPDGNGNLTVVFARSGAAEFASLRYTGRLASEPLGRLQQSAELKAGVANYQKPDSLNRNRWGDYFGAASDPAAPLRTWVYGEYASTANQWATWVGASQF